MPVEVDLISELPVVYVSSALINMETHNSSSLDYFVQLITHLSYNFHEKTNHDLIVKIPKSNNVQEQIEFIDQIYSRHNTALRKNGTGLYSALIISPIKTAEIHDKLEQFIHSLVDYKKLPIFTIDKRIDASINGIRIPYVTSDWEYGGKLIAQCVIDSIIKNNSKKAAQIAILYGPEGSEKRIDGFIDGIVNGQLKPPHIIPCKDENRLNFTREGTYEYFQEKLKDSETLDFVFAPNDEMALGVKDALDEDAKFKDTKVTGFDGTKEFILSMENPETQNLLATIDVKIDKQVDKLIELVLRIAGNIDKFDSNTEDNFYCERCDIITSSKLKQ